MFILLVTVCFGPGWGRESHSHFKTKQEKIRSHVKIAAPRNTRSCVAGRPATTEGTMPRD